VYKESRSIRHCETIQNRSADQKQILSATPGGSSILRSESTTTEPGITIRMSVDSSAKIRQGSIRTNQISIHTSEIHPLSILTQRAWLYVSFSSTKPPTPDSSTVRRTIHGSLQSAFPLLPETTERGAIAGTILIAQPTTNKE
jgi:hypothetical protein